VFLRKIVLMLIAANVAYFAYSQGWISRVIGSDAAQREPARLAKQINPDALAVSLAPAKVLTTISEPSPLPNSTAVLCSPKVAIEEEWLVYMGPYANKELMEKKKSELQKLGISGLEVSKTSLPRGLSLGRYPNETAARNAWRVLQGKGIKTATVLLWTTPSNNATGASGNNSC
jgi:hypothetical protein